MHSEVGPVWQGKGCTMTHMYWLVNRYLYMPSLESSITVLAVYILLLYSMNNAFMYTSIKNY